MTNNTPQDKLRTNVTKEDNATFNILDPDYNPPLEQVTCVAVVPFDKDGNIVVALLDRGPDLPGGHIQIGETSFEETAKREAMKEAFITLDKLETICILQSDYYGSEEQKLTYIIIMTAIVDEFKTVKPNEESKGRKIISTDEFLKVYSAGDKNMMTEVISRAKAVHTRKVS